MDLDFNACLTLLIIAFVFSLIIIRCLMGMINYGYEKGMSLINTAVEELYPAGKKPGGKFGLMDMVGFGFEIAKPQIRTAIEGIAGTKPK